MYRRSQRIDFAANGQTQTSLSGGDRTWEQPFWLTTDKETMRLFLSWFIPQLNTLQYGNDKFSITADLLIEFSYSGLICLFFFNMLDPQPIKRISALSKFIAFWAFHPLLILLYISCFSYFTTTIRYSALSFLNILNYQLLEVHSFSVFPMPNAQF